MTQRIISRADWRPAELEQSGRWLRILTDRERADLRAGLDGLKASGRPMLEITRADVPLGAFAAVLAEAEAEMEEGIGFLVLRGLPMEGQGVEENRLMAWAIGAHLGVARPQGKASQLISDVRDAGALIAAAAVGDTTPMRSWTITPMAATSWHCCAATRRDRAD